MFPYWALFTIFAAGALLNTGTAPRKRISSLLVIALVAVTVMIGFRYKVGGDWDNYQYTYVLFRSVDLGRALSMPNSDPAYSVLNWIGQAFGMRIWFVNLISACIFVWGLTKLAIQQPRPWVFFLTIVPYGLIVVGMGYTRQSVAIGLVAAALASFRASRTRGAALYNAAAVLFHKSCIFMLPLIALSDRRRRFINIVLMGILLILLYYSLVSESKEELVEKYLSTAMASSGAGIRVTMTLWPAVFFLLFPSKFGFDELESQLWRNLSYAAIASFLSLWIVPSSTVIDRLTLYLIPFQGVIVSRIPWIASKNGVEFSVTLLLVFYAGGVLFVWLNYGLNSIWWIPYRFFPVF
jgi:hypothetical protein